MATATETIEFNGKHYPLAPVDPPQSEHPEAEWFVIMPSVAEAWLKWNRSNRNLRKGEVSSHASDIGSGKWGVNGETVKLSRPLRSGEVEDMPEGRVLFLDGQHRLEGCVASGKPFITLVAWGLEPEARDTMDTGVTRKMSDVLKMKGEALTPALGSIVRRVHMWDGGDRRFSANRKPTHAEMLELFSKDPQGFRCAADKGYWVRNTYKDLAPAVTGTAWYLLNRISPEDAPWFFSALRSGADLSENHPVLILRNRITRDRAEKKSGQAAHQVAMIVRAWNYYRMNQPMFRMDQGPNDPTPDPR